MNSENSTQEISHKIYLIRNHRVMLDVDLAELYGVKTKNLNKAVSRNLSRFPVDFMFQLTEIENNSLRFQTGTLESGRGKHSKYLPYVFTEQGVAMLSGVLKSERAVQANIAIMRTFIKLRRTLELNQELVKKLGEIESKILEHDQEFESVFEAIRRLMDIGSPLHPKPIKPIGK